MQGTEYRTYDNIYFVAGETEIRLSVVNPSAVLSSWLGPRLTARLISEKEQNSSVRLQPVRCPQQGAEPTYYSWPKF